MLGRLPADSALGGALTLDPAAAERAVRELAAELALEPEACAEGIIEVAESEMLGALRLLTVERGIDPRRFALMPFGGAGGLHAVSLAERLGIEKIICPSAGGVLSALGLAAAPPRRDASRTVMLDLAAGSESELEIAREALCERAAAELGVPAERIRVRHELRYRGQSFELPVEEERGTAPPLGPAELAGAFASVHEARYGYRDETGAVELVTLRASAWAAAPALAPITAGTAANRADARPHRVRLHGASLDAPIHTGMPAGGEEITGPAIVALADSTILIGPGWRGSAAGGGALALERVTGG